jgi:hypothetical protein
MQLFSVLLIFAVIDKVYGGMFNIDIIEQERSVPVQVVRIIRKPRIGRDTTTYN